MVYHGISFYDNVITHRSRAVVCHGVPWCTMVNYSKPWYTMVHNGNPWCTIFYYGVPWTNRRRHDDKGSTLWPLKTNPLPSWQEGALTILCILYV